MDETRPTGLPASFPASLAAAAGRAALGACPRCGEARLFSSFLKPVEKCPGCGQDWTHQRADDFPAYLAILATGHLLAPVIIWMVEKDFSPSTLAAVLLPLSMAMLVGMLQPAKGAVIALQWWLGLHGFRRERPD